MKNPQKSLESAGNLTYFSQGIKKEITTCWRHQTVLKEREIKVDYFYKRWSKNVEGRRFKIKKFVRDSQRRVVNGNFTFCPMSKDFCGIFRNTDCFYHCLLSITKDICTNTFWEKLFLSFSLCSLTYVIYESYISLLYHLKIVKLHTGPIARNMSCSKDLFTMVSCMFNT